MAVDLSKEGRRSAYIKSLFGRAMGFQDANMDVVCGPVGYANPIDGFSAGGSTIVSTSVANNLPGSGVSMVGASGASGTTAYNLAAPVPGVRKMLFNPTTGVAVIGTTGAGAFINSTGSVTSTLGSITLGGKGAYIELFPLSSALWGVVNVSQISTGGIGVTLV